jgi:hypothetical protein
MLLSTVLKVADGRYSVPNIQNLVDMGGPLQDNSDIGRLFHLVYVEIPHKMKPGLRPDTNRDITMKEYFHEFPVTLEALILMMFQTIPEYLIGEKENQNRLTRALEGARRVSLQSISDRQGTSSDVHEDPEEEAQALPKKRGGRPANKEGFVVNVFDKYRKEVDDRRDFNYPPSETDKKEAYEEWKKRRDDGEFQAPKKFYERALAAINKKNKDARKRSFMTAASIFTAGTSCPADINASDEDVQEDLQKVDERAAQKYKGVHGEKRKFDQAMNTDELETLANDYETNPENVLRKEGSRY